MASFVQAKRDLGCKAPQVTLLEEGINTDSRWAKEFWTLLGGKTKYRGAHTHTVNIENICTHTHTYIYAYIYMCVYDMDRLKLFKLAPLSVQHRAFLHNFFCSTSVLTQFSVDQTLSQLATSLRRMPTLEHYLPIPPLFWGRMTTTWSYAAGLCGRGTTTGGRFFFNATLFFEVF